MQQVEVPDKDSAVAWLRPRLPHLRTLHVRYAPSGCGSDACSVSEGPLSLLLTSSPPPAAPLLEALVLFTEWDKVGFQDTQDVNNHLLCPHNGILRNGRDSAHCAAYYADLVPGLCTQDVVVAEGVWAWIASLPRLMRLTTSASPPAGAKAVLRARELVLRSSQLLHFDVLDPVMPEKTRVRQTVIGVFGASRVGADICAISASCVVRVDERRPGEPAQWALVSPTAMREETGLLQMQLRPSPQRVVWAWSDELFLDGKALACSSPLQADPGQEVLHWRWICLQ